MWGRQRSLGICLTDHGASFVELERLFGRVRVIDSGCLDLDKVVVKDGAATDARARSGEERRRRFAAAEQVIVGVPRREVVCRFIDVPNVGEDQLPGLLSFEIERHLPFPVEEACYSYRIISARGSTARVLLMAAKRSDVERALARVEPLGLTPTAVDVSSMAATTALLFQKQGVPAHQTLTLIQVESGEATVDVLFHDALVSSRTVVLGGELSPFSVGSTSARQARDTHHDCRLPIDGYLTFASDHLTGEGQVANVSSGGLCVTSEQTVDVGSALRVSLMLPELNDPLDVELARVQWVGGRRFGLAMETMNPDVRRQLQRYVSQITDSARPPSAAVHGQSSHSQSHVVEETGEARASVDGYVTFFGEGVEGEGTVTELSAHGWRIASDHPVRCGMVFTLHAAFPELNDPVVVLGARVQWTGTGKFGLYAQIVEKESRVRIASYLRYCRSCETSPARGMEDTAAVVEELKRVTRATDVPPGPILLHGDVQHIGQQLREEFGYPVDVWDTSGLATDPAAFGLALRGLPGYALPSDLLPAERRVARKNSAVALCWSLLALVGCLSLGWWANEAVLERRVSSHLEATLQHVRGEASAVVSLKQDDATLTTRLRTLERLASAQGRSMHLLREVVTLLPPDVLLHELSFDGHKVRLRGSTTASAALLISAFEQSAFLENAAFTAPISVQGKDRQAFEIAVTLRAVPRLEAVDKTDTGPS